MLIGARGIGTADDAMNYWRTWHVMRQNFHSLDPECHPSDCVGHLARRAESSVTGRRCISQPLAMTLRASGPCALACGLHTYN